MRKARASGIPGRRHLDAGDREALIRRPRRCRAPHSSGFRCASRAPRRFEGMRANRLWSRRRALAWRDHARRAATRHPDRERVTNALLAGIGELGLDALPWTRKRGRSASVSCFAREVDAQAPRPWPDVSDAALSTTLHDWLAPWLDGMSRRDHLARLDMTGSWQPARLESAAAARRDRADAPAVPSDRGFRSITPRRRQSAVRLQEVFGLSATPASVGPRAVDVAIAVAPHRPVQVTKDLTSFWRVAMRK